MSNITKKARFIEKLSSLSAEEKRQAIEFFTKHPIYESRIDWNKKDLGYIDFEKLFFLAEKSRKNQKRTARKNPHLQFDKYNCRIVAQTDDFLIIVPLDWECAQFMNSFDCGGEGAKWCIGDSNSYYHWNRYLERKYIFYFVYFININPFYGKKLMIYHDQKKKVFSIADQNDKISHVPVFKICNAAEKMNVRSTGYCDIFLQILKIIGSEINNIHSGEKPRRYRERKTIRQRIGECRRYKKKILNLIGVDHYYIPKEIAELTWLKELTLKIQKGQLLPGFICGLKNLEKLVLETTDLVPETLRSLTWIKSLSLTGDFSVLPDWIGYLTSLQKLEIESDNLSRLPEAIQNLPSLKKLVLNISHNFLSIPVWLEKLIALEELEISISSLRIYSLSGIQRIPPCLKKLRLHKWSILPKWECRFATFEELEIGYCDLPEIPEWIGTIKSLKRLTIKCNNFRNIPDSIGNLISLEYLKIRYNEIEYLPDTIGNLQSLKYLDISSNKLKKLPDSIGNLALLERLDIPHNKIEYLPDTIGNLQSLKYLDISSNELKKLPDSIGNLTLLEHLDISNNKIEYLPDTIGNLQSLRYLDISFNELKKLPDSIGNLTLLEEFNLRINKLSELPESIVSLKNLNSLNLFRLRLNGSIMKQIQKYRRTGETSNLPESFLVKCIGGRYVNKNSKPRKKTQKNIKVLFEKNKCSIIGENDDFLILILKTRKALMYFTAFEEKEEVFWSVKGSDWLWKRYIQDGNLFYCVYFYNENPFLCKKVIIQYNVKDDEVYTWLPNHEEKISFSIIASQLRRNYCIGKGNQEAKQLFFDFYFDNVIIDNKKTTDNSFLLQLVKKAYEYEKMQYDY
jgi:Leucine-rich repeat (LRR) protein